MSLERMKLATHLWIAVPASLWVAFAGASSASAQWSGHATHGHGSDARRESAHYHDEYAPIPPPDASWRARASQASYALSVHATHFAEVVQNVAGYAHLSRDAAALAHEASRFHAVVAQLPSPQYASAQFQRLEREHGHLRDAFSRAHDAHHIPHLSQDLAVLTHAFLETRDAIALPPPRVTTVYRPRPDDRPRARYRDRYDYARRPLRRSRTWARVRTPALEPTVRVHASY